MRVSRADFTDNLGEMREWLDRQNRPLVRFETEADGATISISVQSYEVRRLFKSPSSKATRHKTRQRNCPGR